MGDLRSQLLKAGLVSEKAVKQAESEARKRRSKNRSQQPEVEVEQAAARQEQEEAFAKAQGRKREQQAPYERERKREERQRARRRKREAREQARRLIAEHGEPVTREAEVAYRFVEEGKTVKTIYVTREQQKRLGHGELGVARPHANVEEYALVGREAALKLKALCPEKLVLLHDPDDKPDEFDGLTW
jgi:Uncharacterized protein conserved in bacteria